MTQDDKTARLAALRVRMAARRLQGYIVPRSDEYLGEYVPPSAERLAWLTGFTGSAGLAVMLIDKAVVMSDGRYALQLGQQVDAGLFSTAIAPPAKPAEWISEHAPPGCAIGYDPKVMTGQAIQAMAAALADKGIRLEPVEGNLVDAVWSDRPLPPASAVEAFPETLAGRSTAAKRHEVLMNLAEARKNKAWNAMVLNAPESIAWLLNIRGDDVPHTPFALSTALVHDDGRVDWFIDKARLAAEVAAGLGNQVQIVPPAELPGALDAQKGRTVLLDDGATPVWFRQRLEGAGAVVEHQPDPCVLPRACKTTAEQAAIRDVHVRDGVAMVKFLHWLDGEAPRGRLSEQDVVDRLQAFRTEDAGLRDTSFDTIAGWNENGAIVHYHVTPDTNKAIVPPGLLLVDSGGQYREGTTDITRTVAVGEPTPEMVRHNTLVLKGHIAIASLTFPEGVQGRFIDVLARQALWREGLDYAHGTGHGVGCYLSVHESGIGISFRNENEFRPGMLVSNEPGYYRTGAYGIRIENLVLVVEDGLMETGQKRLRFDTVTLAPFDRRLIDVALLDRDEIEWVDAYHADVLKKLGSKIGETTKAWLQEACAPLSSS